MKTLGTYHEWYCEETQGSQILQQNNLQYIQKTITNRLLLGVQSKFNVNGQKLKMYLSLPFNQPSQLEHLYYGHLTT